VGARCTEGAVALSNVALGAPTSRERGPRYLLITCYAVGCLVGAVVLALLALLAFDGHPLPLLAAAVGALLPFPLRGIACLLGVPRPAGGRPVSRRSRMPVSWQVPSYEVTSASAHLSIFLFPTLRRSRILTHPRIWFRLLRLKIQRIFRSPPGPATEESRATQAVPAPGETRAPDEAPVAGRQLSAESWWNLHAVAQVKGWSLAEIEALIDAYMNPLSDPGPVYYSSTVSGPQWQRLHDWIYGRGEHNLWRANSGTRYLHRHASGMDHDCGFSRKQVLVQQ